MQQSTYNLSREYTTSAELSRVYIKAQKNNLIVRIIVQTDNLTLPHIEYDDYSATFSLAN